MTFHAEKSGARLFFWKNEKHFNQCYGQGAEWCGWCRKNVPPISFSS
jgi:hypothetical protein